MADPQLRYLKVQEVAKRLSLDESTVYKMIRSGLLPSVRIGRKAVRVPADRFETYLREIAADDRGVRDEKEKSSHASDDVATRLAAFVNATGVNPFIFIDGWKKGLLDDNDENGELLVEALSLRTAIGRRVNETAWRVLPSDERGSPGDEQREDRDRASLFRRRRK